MTKLEQLIKELCPNGVEYKKLSDIATVARGVRVVRDQLAETGDIPVFVAGAFRDGGIKTTGTDIDRILPAVSRFSGGNRKEKKETVIEKLKAFFERFWGIG